MSRSVRPPEAPPPAQSPDRAQSPNRARTGGPGPDRPIRGRSRLSTGWIFFLIVSAASPLTSILGATPQGFVSGNGAGLPAAYLVVTVLMVCFAVGSAAISRRLVNTGAFYTYVARGIGRPPAIGVALVAVVSYGFNTAGIIASGGYFAKLVAQQQGTDIGWFWGAAVLLVGVGLLGYRALRVSAVVLGTLTALGLVALVVFDLLVIARHGVHAFPAASFAPHQMLSGSPGLAVLVALSCFVGVETAALYSEETRDPERTVPRAIYAGVIGMGIFYVLSIWILVGSIGADRTLGLAQQKSGELVFDQVAEYGGSALQTALALLFIGAALAASLAFHNAASRYLFVLGRDRVLPGWLGHLHPAHRSPARASFVITAAVAVILVGGGLLGLDPYKALSTGAVGLATLGIVALQAFAAVAIVVFFRRRGQGRYWVTLVVPGLAAIGLAAATVLELLKFSTIVNSTAPVAVALPWVLVLVMLGGVITGLVIRRRYPARYARLAESRLRPVARQLRRPAGWTRRYCLVGAGPAGLAMARRLHEEGVPFDWYESHHDVGGLWHVDRPDSPGYDTTVAISSRYTSGFPDFPMPADFPDYPRWWQVRDYLREFAARFGLYDLVQLNTRITWVKPDGVGWSVTLSSGGVRYYSGMILAPGKAWEPHLPRWPGVHRFHGQLFHSIRYTSPADLAGRRVLVVGAGNSAAEIAGDAARSAVFAAISVRSGHRFVPRHVDGVPTDALLAGLVEPSTAAPLPADLVDTGAVPAPGLPLPDRVLTAHPTVSDELVDHVAAGRIGVRPDIAEILPDGVRYVDGTTEGFDVIVAATGYEPAVPFLADEAFGGPDELYLNLFSRRHDGLVMLGLSEFGGATFPRFDDAARAVIVDITLRELGGVDWRAWLQAKTLDRPDLRGGQPLSATARGGLLVDDHAYEVLLRDVADRFGYAPVPTPALALPVPVPGLA
jgi:amino acid transporter